jgi:hypothetical protein
MEIGQLSANFWLREFTESDHAARMGIKIVAPAEVILNLQHLCVQVLQPLRDEVKRVYHREYPFSVTSGYRPPWLNTLVKGSKHSAHLWGGGADTKVPGISVYDFSKFVEGYVHILPIDQVIYEYGEWTHIAIAPDGKEPRRQVLTAVYDHDTKEARYLPGIIKQ